MPWKQGGVPLEPAPDAPEIEWTSGPTDNTPQINLTGDIAEGDTIRWQFSLAADFSSILDTASNTVDAAEDAADALTFTLTNPLPDATVHARARIEKPGHEPSAYSASDSQTIDATGPTIQSVAFTSNAGGDNTYKAGDTVQITITWNEAATVTGTPQLTVNCGGSNRTFNYASGTGSTALVFSYTVQAGDTDANGLSIAANSLALNSGTIKDAATNNATLTHSAVTDQAAHKVDTTAPTVSGFSPLDDATGVAINATLTATFNEPVTLGASGTITLKKTSDNTTVDSWDVATEGGSGAGQVEVLTSTALTLHLTANLANNTGYYIVWDAGVVKDAAGNNVAALSATTTWNFTTVAGGGLTTVFNVTLTTADNGWVGSTIVQLLSASNLSAATGTQVRLTLKFATNLGNGTTIAVYMGQKAAAGDAFDFANTPAHILFSGTDVTGDNTTVDYVSDFVNLPEAYDETKDYLVAIEFAGGGSANLLRATSTGDQSWFKGGADAATVNKSGYTSNFTNSVDLITKVEIQ